MTEAADVQTNTAIARSLVEGFPGVQLKFCGKSTDFQGIMQ
jgi:hypothetical protein